MKSGLVFAAALALALPAGAIATSAPAQAAHVVVHKHGGVSVRHGRGHVATWHKPRAHEFHWRGKWVARGHGPRFVWPHGHHYRHWVVGGRLPAVFLTSAYFYDGYASFGFHAPPSGYRWVRYGDDLVLVNVRTGEIEDIAYGAFE